MMVVMTAKPLPWWITGLLGAASLLVLSCLERRRPLRRSVEPKLRREARNLSVAGLSAVALVLAERPIVMPLAGVARRPGLGFAPSGRVFDVNRDRRRPGADGLYILHLARADAPVPFLWRFHLVHHVDLDLDASTALRFHFTEMLASFPGVWRRWLSSVDSLTFSIWQCAFLLSILFHHSNVELPVDWERWLNKLVVTPRMHGIHHSIVERETNSNWSSGLTIWDWLHRTLRLNVPQSEVTIGVPAFQEPKASPCPDSRRAVPAPPAELDVPG